MNEAADGVHDQPAHGYAACAVLDARISESLAQANRAFLELIALRHAERPSVSVFGLAPAVAARVAALGGRGRAAAAGGPYTLFNMGYEDSGFWRGIAAAPRVSAAGAAGAAAAEVAFARTAVYLAWHLAHSGELAAALVLGMTPAVQQAWRGLPLSAIDQAALEGCSRLEARWGRSERFWPRLAAAAARERSEELEAVRLLGLQLLAAGGIAVRGYGVRLPGGS